MQHVPLAERLDEAYRNDELKPEEREFLDLIAEHVGERLKREVNGSDENPST